MSHIQTGVGLFIDKATFVTYYKQKEVCILKRITSVILILSLIFLMSGCKKEETPTQGYAVPSPLSYPDYTFDTTPDATTLRKTAVRAMRDILSIQWHTDTELSYYKSGPVSNKEFKHTPNNIYAGLIYTNANAGIFQFMEFYDQNTGLLHYDGSINDLKSDIGTSCADAVLWAWATVCTSIEGPYFPKTMVMKNGYIPVGEYTYDPNLDNFNYYPTLRIVADNGIDVMMRSYAQVQPADALTTSTDNHAIMAIEPAHVVYLPDGSIDSVNSYIMIQDQRAFADAWKQTDENGNVLNYSGRTSAKFTFQELYDEHFLPVSAAEFLGEKAYEKAEVNIYTNCSSMEELQNASVSSNYPLAVVNLLVNDQVVDRELFGGNGNNGVPRSFALNQLDSIKNYETSGINKSGANIKIEVVVATGERFIPIEFTI